MTPSLEIESRPHWWEASALTTTPPLLSLNIWKIMAETRGYIFRWRSRSRRRRLCLSSLLTKRDLRTGLRVLSNLIYFNKERKIHAQGRGSRKTWRDATVFGARASLTSRVVWISRVSGHFACFSVCLTEIRKYSPTRTSQSRNIEFYQAWVLTNP